MYRFGQLLAMLLIITLLLIIGGVVNEFWEALRAPILGFGLFYCLYLIYRKIDHSSGVPVS